MIERHGSVEAAKAYMSQMGAKGGSAPHAGFRGFAAMPKEKVAAASAAASRTKNNRKDSNDSQLDNVLRIAPAPVFYPKLPKIKKTFRIRRRRQA